MTEVIRRVTWPVRWINHAVSRFFTGDPERVCKEPRCGRLLFVWQNGKYCSFHSRRAHTVLVVLPKNKSGK